MSSSLSATKYLTDIFMLLIDFLIYEKEGSHSFSANDDKRIQLIEDE
jgi:hypothetical protein